MFRGVPYRLYYSENTEKPEFIGLSFKRKWINGTLEEIREHQNGDAHEAQERYNGAIDYHWGHKTKSKRCAFCFGDSVNDLI